MITASFPIVHSGKTQGVAVDINIENFSKLHAINEDYPGMYANVFSKNAR